jgi:hypothetical protein
MADSEADKDLQIDEEQGDEVAGGAAVIAEEPAMEKRRVAERTVELDRRTRR